MKFSISQSELLNALTVVQKGLAQRASLPILAGIYMETQGDAVLFQATNLEMSVRYQTAALVEEEGKAVLPGKVFIDVVKSLPDAAVFIETNEDTAMLTCESSSFSIRVLDPLDFPAFPQVDANQQITVPFDDFSSMARKVSRIAAKDESRPMLTGVLLEVEAGMFKMVATDSYRLGVCEHPLEGAAVDDFKAVLFSSFVLDLAGLPKTGEDISIGLAENQVIVTYGPTIFVNRRIEGNYPNYQQLIPDSYNTRAVMDRAALLAAVKRASVLDSGASQIRFSLNAPSQTVQLTTTQDVGSTQEIVKASIEGEDVEIAFNSHYVIDGISAITSDEIALELQGPMKQGIMRGTDEEERFLYLVMPVRI